MTGSADLVFNIALEEDNLGGAYQCARIGGGLSRVPAESWLGGGAQLVGIEGGVVSGCFNPNESSVDALDRRPRHDEHYHEAWFLAA